MSRTPVTAAPASTASAGLSNRNAWTLVILLTVFAAALRLWDLDRNSFQGDEETTAFGSITLATDLHPQLPSGMLYLRALPHTVLNAGAAQLFGLRNEAAYRLPSSLLGMLSIPLIFILARRGFGTSVGVFAAALLALSEWHVLLSREARMYAPFAFAFIASCIFAWQWAEHGRRRDLALAVITYIFSSSLHAIAVFGALIPALAAACNTRYRVRPIPALAYAVFGAAWTFGYEKLVETPPYLTWIDQHGVSLAASQRAAFPENLQGWTPWIPVLVTLALAGLALGIYAARRVARGGFDEPNPLQIWALYVGCGVAGALAALGQVLGAMMIAVAVVLISRQPLLLFLRNSAVALIGLAALSAVCIALMFWRDGAHDALREMFLLPYPNFIEVIAAFPGTSALAALAIAVALWRPRSDQTAVCAVFVLVVFFVVGSAQRWGGLRYSLSAYPFLLCLAACGALVIARVVAARQRLVPQGIAVAALLTLAGSGVLLDSGVVPAVRASLLTHGDWARSLGYAVYPDHRSAGQFVKEQLDPSDIVVVEDALEQMWYVGRVDYWLRGLEEDGQFMYRSHNGEVRDIYTDTRVLLDESLPRLEEAERPGRIWVITSAEVAEARQYYLSKDQMSWLTRLEQTTRPAYEGRDGVTRVYCLDGRIACPQATS